MGVRAAVRHLLTIINHRQPHDCGLCRSLRAFQPRRAR